ncbi:hypothetical protein EDC04DRAFT_2618949 [Pisolithus marmoratus]|nr:hypothetical protein EDC04DRAFT_2618949 [Pisolithus marmoratus]
MFRSIESVYKVNRVLLGKLKDIGRNPSSPKALGDLLMRWIDDLDRPYTIYAEKYFATTLGGFSLSNPPPASIAQTGQLPDPSIWTLDALFLLPKGRLQYYRKLYSRLLKSTTPGRSDYRLLTGALEKLDALLTTLDSRAGCRVETYSLSSATSEGANGLRSPTGDLAPGSALLAGRFGAGGGSNITASETSSSSTIDKHPAERLPARINLDLAPPVASVSDLEKRLTTEGTLDIFTMEPKQVRLQLLPPSLPYTRELRASVAVVIRIIPKSTGVEVVHRHGHVFILSDLFLVCERMSPEERLALGADMRLCYPPISGKVLKVTDVPEQGNALNVSLMRKETLTLEADSQYTRDQIMKEFMECISFSRTISGAAQEPVPPLPSKGVISPAPAAPSKSPGSPPELLRSHSNGFVQQLETKVVNENLGGISSPSAPLDSTLGHPRLTSPAEETITQSEIPVSLGQLHGPRTSAESSLSSAAASPESQAASVPHRVPSLQSPLASPIHLARQPSVPQGAKYPQQSTFVPGQVIPRPRGDSMQSSHPVPDSMFTQAPPRVHSPPSQSYVGQPVPPASLSIHNLHRGSPHNPPISVSIQHPPRPATSQTYSSRQPGPQYGALPERPPSEPSASPRLHKSPSSRSLVSQYVSDHVAPPPMPSFPGGLPASQRPYPGVAMSPTMSRPSLPSQMGSRTNSLGETSFQNRSPPTSPIEEPRPLGPTRSTVFLKQHHAQWKSLGSARLTLYRQEPTNIKQLVVEADSKDKGILISTIVLTDGVERVGKTGVAIELSDAKGGRTGVIYMIQLRSESSAGGLFETLLAGSDRSSK